MASKIFNSFRHQSFSFPDTVIYYITQKPSSPKGYEKLIQTCKYFFAKNPIIILHCLCYNVDTYKWKTCLRDGEPLCTITKDVNFDNTAVKLWITDNICIWAWYSKLSNLATSIIKKLYKYNILHFEVQSQTIYFDDLRPLFPFVKFLNLNNTFIISKNGSNVSVTKIIEAFPKLCGFSIYCREGSVAQNTVNELLKIPQFYNLQFFKLCCTPESFDIEKFYGYLMKNKQTFVSLEFSDITSEVYRNRLEAIIDEILQNTYPEYEIPFINFPQMDLQKKCILSKRISRGRK